MEKEKLSRRNFIETALAGGIGAGVGLAGGAVIQNLNRQTVRLLTADGQLVEVEKRHLPNTGNIASNQVIMEWMKNNKAG